MLSCKIVSKTYGIGFVIKLQMIDLIKEILKSPAGSFGFVAGVLGLIGFVVYKSGGLVQKFGIVDKLEKSIDKIKEDIAEIKAFMSIIRQKQNPLAETKSPISLSTQGEQVSSDLKIKRIVTNNWEQINEKIKSCLKKEDNPYNIQQICFDMGKKYSEIVSKEELDYIKTYAFEHGFNLSDFDIVFGIEIRDTYFKQENLAVASVDAHDPGKIV